MDRDTRYTRLVLLLAALCVTVGVYAYRYVFHGTGQVSPSPSAGATLDDTIPKFPDDDDVSSQEFKSPLSVRDAEAILLRTRVFAVSFNAMYVWPRQLHAFNRLMDQPDGREHFDFLSLHGRSAGRLYALCAFQLLDPRRASDLASELRTVDEAVHTIDGDQWEQSTVVDLVEKAKKDELGKQFREHRALVYQSFHEAG